MTFKDSLQTVHRWAGQTRPRVNADTGGINFVFDGAGNALVAGGRANITIGTSGRIVRATILADLSPATASFVLLRGTYLEYPFLNPIYTVPATQAPTLLVGDLYKKECSLLGWETRVQAQDTMICVLEAITGGVTSITLALQIRKIYRGVAPL